MKGRFFISACKGRPVPFGLSKVEPYGFSRKIFRASLAVFSRKTLHNPLRMKLFDYRQWQHLTYPSVMDGTDKWETELEGIINSLMVSPQ